MTHAIIEACINAREHSGCADNRIYLRFVGTSQGDGSRIDIWITDHGQGIRSCTRPGPAGRAPAPPTNAAGDCNSSRRTWTKSSISTVAGGGTTIHMVKYEKKES